MAQLTAYPFADKRLHSQIRRLRSFCGREASETVCDFASRFFGVPSDEVATDGAYCLFVAPVTGSRQGKTVLVQLRDATDPETGERYTVKRYQSEKIQSDEGAWRHCKITLKPNNPDFQAIELTVEDEGEFRVIAEFLEVLG